MSFDYSNLKATAERLILRFGKAATLVKTTTTGPDYDPTVTEVTSNITLVELEYNLAQRDGTMIQQGDKRFLVSTTGSAPEQPDKIRLDSVDYSVLQVDPLNPGGTVLLYEVQARA